MPSWDSLWTNVHLATMTEERGPYGAIPQGALAVLDGRIAWVGAETDLPHRDARALIDGRGGWLTPGLIDCHTHLVFARRPRGRVRAAPAGRVVRGDRTRGRRHREHGGGDPRGERRVAGAERRGRGWTPCARAA